MGKVVALAAYLLKNGSYSNGAGDQSSIMPRAQRGQARPRSSETTPIVGDDEQYAATMALLANVVGVPARVSLDALVEADGSVYGKDVRADVELDTAAVRLGDAALHRVHAHQEPDHQAANGNHAAGAGPGRPAPAQPVGADRRGQLEHRRGPRLASTPSVTRRASRSRRSCWSSPRTRESRSSCSRHSPPRWPVPRRCAVGAAASFGPPAARVAGAWRELIDLGRDLGIERAAPATPGSLGTSVRPAGRSARRRAGSSPRTPRARGLPSAAAVADAADAATFGPADPDGAAAARVWQLVETSRRDARRRRCPGGGAHGSRSTRRACGRPARARPRHRPAAARIRSSGGRRGAGGGTAATARGQRRGRVIPGGAYR